MIHSASQLDDSGWISVTLSPAVLHTWPSGQRSFIRSMVTRLNTVLKIPKITDYFTVDTVRKIGAPRDQSCTIECTHVLIVLQVALGFK
jgi:hypothetical protein